MTSLAVMRLFSEDLTAIGDRLRSQIERAPSLFRGAPLAIDLAALESAELDLAGLVELVRGQGIVPVAIRGGDDAMRDIADELNLGVLEWTQETVTEPQIANQDTAAEPQPTQPKTQDPKPATRVEKTPTRLITQPVRSGQHIYARGGDLLVLGTVSAGAEVIADGHIHVYGKLHGRALAGAQGDGEARIFVQSLEAELIAVAGVYMVSEELNEELRGSAVQAYLQGENLVLEAL
jgi:septum site-determining protein MinC